MTPKQLEIVGHTLGTNVYNAKLSTRKKDKFLPDEFYRNYFCAGTKKHDDYPILMELEKEALTERWTKFTNLYFGITQKGINKFREEFASQITTEFLNLPPIPKGKNTYMEYLDAEVCESFPEYIGIQLPEFEYDRFRGVRLVSTKYHNVWGDYKLTKKEAKVSYKEKLKAHLNK